MLIFKTICTLTMPVKRKCLSLEAKVEIKKCVESNVKKNDVAKQFEGLI